jgi:PAS domain S-box-containing protein
LPSMLQSAAPLATLLLSLASLCASAASPKRVLILDPFGRDVAPYSTVVASFRSTLARELGAPVDIYELPLDLARFGESEGEGPLVAFLEGRIKSQPVDLVVPIASAGLQFAARHRGRLFPDTPFLVLGAPARVVPADFLRTNATLVTQKVNIPGMVEDILQVRPLTTNIVVVFGASALERFWVSECKRELQPFTNRVGFTWLNDLSLVQILQRCAALPPRSFILHVLFVVDAAGVPCEKNEALRRLHQVANAPLFGYYASELGLGTIGGRLYQDSEHGVQGARTAIRILRGERPESIPPIAIEAAAPVFDWRELKRWGISETSLPAGSVIQFRQPGFWELYRWPVAGTFLFCLLEAALIIGLLVSRAKRRQGERALRESEERMKLAADAAQLGVWGWNIAFNHVWGSERWLRLFGFASADQVSFENVLERVHPDDRGTVEGEVRKTLSSRSDYAGEFRVLLPEGSQRWIASRGRVFPDANGTPARMLGAAIDITERKRAEAELLLQRAELAHLSRVTMLGELSGSMAHELNQPLTAILSNAQAAQRFLADDQPDLGELRDILADIVAQDKRAGEVIHRLRLLLKKGDVQHRLLSVNDIVLDVLRLVRSDLVNQNLTARTELAPALPLVQGDGVQLQQVLLNLVMNACDAMLGAATDTRQLTIRTGLSEDGSVRVSVIDSGPGIPPDKLEQVFQSFFTTKAQGMGLGLTVSRSIITAHNGQLWATNNPARGAAFHFTLPPLDDQRPPNH